MNLLLTKNKVPPNLFLTATLSGGLTIVVSLIYIALCITALVFRYQCDLASPAAIDSSAYFWNTIYRVYIQSESCGSILPGSNLNLTNPHTVFVFIMITLSFSVVTLIASILLALTVQMKELYQYTNIFVFAYIVAWVAALVVDTTFAIYLGLDYSTLSQELAGVMIYNYELIVIREGSLLLLSIALKGYATYAINMLLIVFLLKYACDYQDLSNTEEHPIHKLGALNAFNSDSQPRRNTWLRRDREQPPYVNPALRGQMNNGYQNDEEPSNSVRNDYAANRSSPFNRSDSWQRQPSPNPQPQLPMGSRPFSYLEEIRRPVAVNPPSTPTGASDSVGGWRRDPWPAPPPVPAPDYSPHGPRRLKSALKPAYM